MCSIVLNIALMSQVDVERQRDYFRHEISNFSKEIELQKRAADADNKAIFEIEGQLKRLGAAFNLSKEKNRMHVELARSHKEVKKNLENDIKSHKQMEERLLKVCGSLLKSRDFCIVIVICRQENHLLEMQQEKSAGLATSWHKKYDESVEKLKLKDMESNELQKKIIEEKNKLKLQQSLYESVRADRNLFSQQHIEAQDEIAEVCMTHTHTHTCTRAYM